MIAVAPTPPKRILYLSGTLPARSETFVYREALGLRRRGRSIPVASVHRPERGLGDPALDQLADEAIPVYGAGIRRLVVDVLREMIARPLRSATTLSRCAIDVLRARDVPLIRRPRILVQCTASLALARRIRPLGISHIHAHMAHVPTTIAMYAAKQLGIGFSFTGHAVDLFRNPSLLDVKIRRAAFISCISRWHREFYRAVVDGVNPRLPLVRCGVDVNAFAPRANAHNSEPRTHNSSPIILAVGRLVPKKGFDLLLKALAEPGAGLRECECIIIGDGPERERLVRLRSELGLREVVRLPGAKSNDEIRRLMQSADVFVLPCRIDSTGDRDGIPVVLMEAMASGLPVISGDLPAIHELIDHERSGLLVNPESDGQLARSLRGLVHDPEKQARLGRAGRRRIQAEFSLEVNLDRLERAFDAALGVDRAEISDAELWQRVPSVALHETPSPSGTGQG